MTQHTDLERIVAGLLSHGFKEEDNGAGKLPRLWRLFKRWDRADRWVREDDLHITIDPDKSWKESLDIPFYTNGVQSSYHALLLKCGDLYLRFNRGKDLDLYLTREHRAQLSLDIDEALQELKGDTNGND